MTEILSQPKGQPLAELTAREQFENGKYDSEMLQSILLRLESIECFIHQIFDNHYLISGQWKQIKYPQPDENKKGNIL